MARKTNRKSTKYKVRSTKKQNNHPRHTRRGWLVLRHRWHLWGAEFVSLTIETVGYLLSKLPPISISVKKKRKRGRPKKKVSLFSFLKRYLSAIYIVVGLIGVGLWLNHWWYLGLAEQTSKSALLTQQLTELPQIDLPHPTHIYIQWFVDADIKDGTVVGNTWTILEKDAVYVVQSARPGQNGNILIYGHNTRDVLGNIRALKGYEKVRLTLSDGSQKWYQVQKMDQVPPTMVKYLEPSDSEILTLYTCAGFADAERFVVQAIPFPENE